MCRVEILGTLELGADGNIHVRRPDIPPLPPRPERPVKVPDAVARAIRENRARVASVVGDSMQPAVLHGDSAVISTTRGPRNGDIVLIIAKTPHRVFGAVMGYVWRYHNDQRRTYLTKDNPRYSDRPSITPDEILGVITQILPRQWRDEFENYERIQGDRALYRSCRWGKPPSDLGFYGHARVAELGDVVVSRPWKC